jgi:UDP-glucose 4-epimerase/UDP-glucuronate decarboxylase
MGINEVLITGGAGFLGLHLARALVNSTTRLALCDNLDRGRMDDDLQAFLAAHPHVTFVHGDLLDDATYGRLGGGYDVVFHLAGVLGVEIVERDPMRVVRANVIGTLRLLEWCTRVRPARVVFASTSEIYAGGIRLGAIPVPTPEEVPVVVVDLAQPRASYALSKAVAEHAVVQYGTGSDSDYVIVRYHNIYGPRMGWDHVVPQILVRLLRGEDPLVVRSQNHTRAFCYIDDAVAATIALARLRVPTRRIVNVGNDQEETSILDLANTLCSVADRHPRIIPGKEQPGSVNRRCPDITLLRRLTGFEPRVPLREGLKATYEWYKSRINS